MTASKLSASAYYVTRVLVDMTLFNTGTHIISTNGITFTSSLVVKSFNGKSTIVRSTALSKNIILCLSWVYLYNNDMVSWLHNTLPRPDE